MTTKIQLRTKTKIQQNKNFLTFKLSDVVFIMLVIAKMPTIVDILTVMSRLKFVLSGVEYEKSSIISGQGNLADCEDLGETRERRHVIRVRSICSNKIKSSGTEKNNIFIEILAENH